MLAACSQDPGLVTEDQIVGDTIPAPLTEQAGRADQGRVVFASRAQGHCVLCHRVDGLDAPFQGNVGPDLTLIGDRLSAEQIRLRIVDYQIVRSGTVMPSYYRIHDLYQVEEDYADQPILTAQQVEDIVAYLSALRLNETNDG